MRHLGTRRGAGLTLVLGFAVFALACGSGGTPPGGVVGPGQGTTYTFIGDAPPAGSSILKFQITFSRAELCPSVSSSGECHGTPVTLVSSPVDIELNQLQLESAFLGLNNVASGTYAGVRLTFSNPELKIVLADGSVQELAGANLPLSPTSVTPTFGSALDVATGSQQGFLIDFNARDSIQSSSGAVTGISPVVSLVQLSASGTQPIEDLADTTGQVSSLSKSCPTGSFALTDAMTGLAIANVRFDSTSEFDGGLSCETLANDQAVEADIELQSPTSQTAQFFAKKIELLGEAGDEGLEGVVFQVARTSQFVLLVNQERNLSTLTTGSFITVNADPARVVYSLESTDLPVDLAAFASGVDVLAGQTIDVVITPGSLVTADTGCADVSDNCSASAEKVRLKKSTLTAQVTGTSDPDFTLVNLPILFGSLDIFRPLSADCQSCAAGSMTVVTSGKTEFDDALGGFSSLQVGDNVTVRGFILKNGFVGPGPIPAGFPQLVAAKVRRLTP
jgi:hypothetical protein